MSKSFLNAPFSLSSIENYSDEVSLASTLYRKHNTYFSKDIFSLDNLTLNHLLRGKAALFVFSETIDRLYGRKIVEFLDQADFKSKIIVIPTGEHNKNLQTTTLLCQQANDFCLNRNHPIVAVGGGICLDICGLAAALFRRGIPHIKIPTTFVGLIDAGIATKNGVNLEKKKNLLGTFYPPEATIIDSSFLKTLPARDIACGTAESLKMAIIASERLYKLWLNYGKQLQNSGLQEPENVSQEVIKLSITSMFKELSTNLYEHNSYQRAVDFGHSFSQYIEQVSDYDIPHGEAVAIDMAISCYISYMMGFLSEEKLEEILQLFAQLHLPCYDPCINGEELWYSLSSIIAHRGGKLNLVIPKGIGQCEFIKELRNLPKSYLEEALMRLENYHVQNGCHPVVS